MATEEEQKSKSLQEVTFELLERRMNFLSAYNKCSNKQKVIRIQPIDHVRGQKAIPSLPDATFELLAGRKSFLSRFSINHMPEEKEELIEIRKRKLLQEKQQQQQFPDDDDDDEICKAVSSYRSQLWQDLEDAYEKSWRELEEKIAADYRAWELIRSHEQKIISGAPKSTATAVSHKNVRPMCPVVFGQRGTPGNIVNFFGSQQQQRIASASSCGRMNVSHIESIQQQLQIRRDQFDKSWRELQQQIAADYTGWERLGLCK